MKPVKKRSKSVSNLNYTKVLSLGHYNIDYSITLNDDDMRRYNLTDITTLKTLDDIKFIIDNISLWNKIRLTTDNNFMNFLLYINKINPESNKIYIEFISYENPVYSNDEVKQMLQSVNETNYFFVNETVVTPEEQKSFTLTIKFKDSSTVINFGDFKDDRNRNVDNEIQEEGTTKQRNEEEPKEEGGEADTGNNIFDKIKLKCESYNYFLCSIGETLNSTPYEDFVDYVIDAKLKLGALICIDYDGDYVEYFSEKETMALLNKLYLITDIFLFDEKYALPGFKKHYEILTKENSKKIYKFGQIEINNYPFGKRSKNKNENEKNEAGDEEKNNEGEEQNKVEGEEENDKEVFNSEGEIHQSDGQENEENEDNEEKEEKGEKEEKEEKGEKEEKEDNHNMSKHSNNINNKSQMSSKINNSSKMKK